MQSLEEENRVGARAPRGRRFGRRACMHAAPPAAFAVRCAATGHAAPHLLSVGRCSQLMAGQLKHFRNVLALSKGASDAYAAVAMRLGLAPGGTGAPAGVTAAPRAEAGGAVSPTPKPSAAGAAAPSRSKLAASKRGQVARARASGEDAQARPQSAPPGRDAQAAIDVSGFLQLGAKPVGLRNSHLLEPEWNSATISMSRADPVDSDTHQIQFMFIIMAMDIQQCDDPAFPQSLPECRGSFPRA